MTTACERKLFNQIYKNAPAETTQEHFEDAERSRDEAESAKAAAKKRALPVFHDGHTGFSPVLLRSALFGTGIGVRRNYDTLTAVTTAGGDTVLVRGPELRQDDQTVLLALIKKREGVLLEERKPGDEKKKDDGSIKFVLRTFAREALGWPDSSDSAAKLLACLERLQTVRVRIKYKDGGSAGLSFVSDYLEPTKDDKLVRVWLSPLLMEMFLRQPTYLDIAERCSLREGMQTWAYGFIESQACRQLFNLSDLKALAGADNCEQHDFNRRKLEPALEVLKAKGYIWDFEMFRTKVRIDRKEPKEA